jgi:hypothetical protein
MDVAVSNERLAVTDRPAFGRAIEIHRRSEHRVVFDGVEEIAMAVEQTPETARGRKEWMRRNNEAVLLLFQTGEVVERAHLLRSGFEIEQQHMTPLNRSFDTRNQNDAALGRVRSQPPEIELPLVEGDGKRAISERRRSIDQLDTGIWDPIDRIVGGVGVELDFQHRPSILDRGCGVS